MLARHATLLGIALVMLIYGELLTHAPATGQDFRLFYAAATVLHEDGNPYDLQQLVRAETRLYHPATAAQRASFQGNPMVQGPLLLIALLPAVGHPPMAAFAVYAAVLGLLAALALMALARAWPADHAPRRAFLGLISPVTFLCVMLGQPDPLLLLSIVMALWLLQRGGVMHTPWVPREQMQDAATLQAKQASHDGLGAPASSRQRGPARCRRSQEVVLNYTGIDLEQNSHVMHHPLRCRLGGIVLARGWTRPALAGFVLSLGLIKPQIIAGPVLLLGLMAAPRRRLAGYCAGLLAGGAGFAGATLLVAGPGVLAGWLSELAGFGKTTIYAQVDISSLSTLYVGWAPHGLSLALTAALLLGWAVVSLRQWRRCGTGIEERHWLALSLTLWLLVTPYAHPHDDILLLPAAWYLLGEGVPNRGSTRLVAALLFVSWWLLPMTSVLGLRPPLMRGLGIIPALLLAVMLLWRSRAPARESQREALEAVVPSGIGSAAR